MLIGLLPWLVYWDHLTVSQFGDALSDKVSSPYQDDGSTMEDMYDSNTVKNKSSEEQTAHVIDLNEFPFQVSRMGTCVAIVCNRVNVCDYTYGRRVSVFTGTFWELLRHPLCKFRHSRSTKAALVFLSALLG